MDRPDELRPRRRELVEAGPLGDAAREQHRAHRAVGQERPHREALAEAFASVHGPKPTRGPPRRRAAGRAAAPRRGRAGPAAAAAGRCTSRTATRRTPRRRGSRRGRRAGAAAGGARRARRSTRRSGRGRRPGPSRPRRGRAAGRRDRSARPARSARRSSWRAPYSAGRISSVMPASSTTWRPPRVRTWSTRATSQPARATRNRPGSIARRRGRRSAGIASSSAGSSRANRAGSRRRLAERRDREPAADVERVERPSSPPRSRASEREPAPDARRATRRPRPAATRRGGGCRAAEPPVEPANASTAVGQLGLGHAELEPPRADREGVMGLGRDLRVQPEQDVERRSSPPAEPPREPRPGRPARRPTRPRPRAAASPRRGRGTAARRSASVLPTPSSVIRSFGTPARAGRRPLAARDDVRAEPAGRRRRPRR